MSDQIILKSVGSYLDTNGHVGPLDANGYPDLFLGTSVDVEELDAEWIAKLNESDLDAVNCIRKDFGLVPINQKPIGKGKESWRK